MAYEYVTRLASIAGIKGSNAPSTWDIGSIDIYLYKDPSTRKLYLQFSDPSRYFYTLSYIRFAFYCGSNYITSNGDIEAGSTWNSRYSKYFEVSLPLGQEVVLSGSTDGTSGLGFSGRGFYNSSNQYDYWYSTTYAIRTGFTPTEENLWNAPPTISGSNTNVGQKTDPFTYAYTVNDVNSTDSLTITEKANGVTIRTITNAVRGQTYNADLSSVWKQMPVNTSTTLTITVSDGKVTTTRTITFTRKEDRVVAYFKQASLTPESVQPEQVLIRVIRTIATNADFKVFVCNNGLDTSPTWEDATSAVLAGEAYTFTNRMKTADNYAVNVKIQVLKNTASAYSYIKALGFSYI